eukprot:TRINITY_DN84270_c0_g1_i1.p1 TRINITY_DN84270_c0_g1~~TRINITY_DN84270_c0_g1_i1.p1  ORF type:complete len:296 (-),score=47.91 TRINITY_DN84270_c0_g1_i1:36-923(-)
MFSGAVSPRTMSRERADETDLAGSYRRLLQEVVATREARDLDHIDHCVEAEDVVVKQTVQVHELQSKVQNLKNEQESARKRQLQLEATLQRLACERELERALEQERIREYTRQQNELEELDLSLRLQSQEEIRQRRQQLSDAKLQLQRERDQLAKQLIELRAQRETDTWHVERRAEEIDQATETLGIELQIMAQRRDALKALKLDAAPSIAERDYDRVLYTPPRHSVTSPLRSDSVSRTPRSPWTPSRVALPQSATFASPSSPLASRVRASPSAGSSFQSPQKLVFDEDYIFRSL